jgi:hypothetical protein
MFLQNSNIFRKFTMSDNFFHGPASRIRQFEVLPCSYRAAAYACVTNPPIPSPTGLRYTCGVFLSIFGWWLYGATTATVLQQFPFSSRRGAVRCTGKDCVKNPPIPSPARLRCTYGVFLGNFSGWPYGATTAAVPFFTPQGRRSRHRQVLTFR